MIVATSEDLNELLEGQYLCYMVQREDMDVDGVRATRPMEVFTGPEAFVDGVCRLEPLASEKGKVLSYEDDWAYETKFFRTRKEAVEQLLSWCREDVERAEEHFKNAVRQYDNFIDKHGRDL